MKRKFIDYDHFNKIKLESFTNTQKELEYAGELLSEVVGLDGLSLDSYTLNSVLFESIEGDFVKTDYSIKNGYVQFDNIEQIVLNEEEENLNAHKIISKMIDSLIDSDEANASERLKEWFSMPRNKRILSEAKQPSWLVNKRAQAKRMNNLKKSPAVKKREKSMRSKIKVGKNERRSPIRQTKNGVSRIVGYKKTKKNMKEWAVLAESVIGFVNYNLNGPELDSCKVLKNGNDIVSVKVPTLKLRNEAKLLRFDWKTMNTDVVIKRNSGKRLVEDVDFVNAIVNLKKLNAFSDKSFEENVEKTVSEFPLVIYLTESELSQMIKSILEERTTNFDDETCGFISEALLRTVCENYVDTTDKIIRLSGASINEDASDKYNEFKTIAEKLYNKLDEQAELEMQAFVDVYEAIRQIHEVAKEEKNENLAYVASEYLNGLLPIVTGKSNIDFEFLGEAAEWLYDIVEASAPESWNAESPVVKYDGEHPDLLKKGRHSQSPADVQGSTPEQHHVSDGKDCSGDAAKELANDGWSNIGGEGVYPSLENPYILNSQLPKIVGEKDVDSDSEQLAHWGDSETWPNLQNPYVKPGVKYEVEE